MKNDSSLEEESLFEVIYEPLPASYNGFAKMRTNNRLRQTEPLFLPNGKPTTFLRKAQQDFAQACVAKGSGHLVVRATGKKHVQLMAFINSQGRAVEVREFDAKKGNIDELNSYLATQPDEPTMVIIRGSMRAGITLGHDNFIRGWIETGSVSSDTQAQSGAGRACGYGRNDESYPIYCDLRHVDAWIKVYDALDKGQTPLAPSGVQNHAQHPRKFYTLKEILPFQEAWDKYVKPARDNEKRKGTEGKKKYRHQIASTAASVFLDVAGMFLEGRRDSGSTMGIHVNGPTTDATVEKFLKVHLKNHLREHPDTTEEDVRGWARRNRASYKRLLKEYPEASSPAYERKVRKDPKALGTVLIFNEEGVDVLRGPHDDLLKKSAAIKSGV